MKQIKLILLNILLILFSTACERDDSGTWITHHKTIGNGYLFDATNNTPLTGATITVKAHCGWMLPAEESYTVDKNGYFQIRFIKKASNQEVDNNYIYLSSWGENNPIDPFYWILLEGLAPADIKDKKVISFDTLKVNRKSNSY
jgi:hypothetical protein